MTAGAAAQDWEAIRADPSIQYAPVAPVEPPKPPEWLEKLQQWLADLLKPVGEALGLSWPTLKWILIGLAVIGVAILAWRLISPVLGGMRKGRNTDPDWSPDREEALALLEDADALAAAGQFDQATHLLLVRSVGQIRAARPDWLEPSSTAREIAMLPALPDAARNAFAIIAERVERSLFALRSLSAEDWQAARTAYADFALTRFEGLPHDQGGTR
ncbi:hypothetical protein MB02_01855 [Croceicoccus estronivorus]|uniref:hypothetical protein n=1 Tax=Croceicoccus estronivorus TaxID=1172626 RepID=UPI00082CDCE6|nr:hypothetical protein [Croceicoccus estronivorus]OCC25695.1 hypothetical protein MB02_01855 [Croceicoccus estronivorus]